MKKYVPIKDYHNDLGYQKEELLKRLPKNLMEDIKQVFKLYDLEFENDINQCTLFINPNRESCFLIYKYVDFLNKGKFICSFREDGSGFHSPILI